MFYNPNQPPLEFDRSNVAGAFSSGMQAGVAARQESRISANERKERERQAKIKQIQIDSTDENGELSIEKFVAGLNSVGEGQYGQEIRGLYYDNEKRKLNVKQEQDQLPLEYLSKAASFAKAGINKEATEFYNAAAPEESQATNLAYDKKTGLYNLTLKSGEVQTFDQTELDMGLVDAKTRLTMQYEWESLRYSMRKEGKTTADDLFVRAFMKWKNNTALTGKGYTQEQIKNDPELKELAYLDEPDQSLINTKLPPRAQEVLKTMLESRYALELIKLDSPEKIQGFMEMVNNIDAGLKAGRFDSGKQPSNPKTKFKTEVYDKMTTEERKQFDSLPEKQKQSVVLEYINKSK